MADGEAPDRGPEFKRFEAHPILSMWPEASEPDLEMVTQDVLRQGVVQDVVVWKGPKGKEYLIDGRTRQEAAARAFARRAEEGKPPEADNGVPLQPGVFEFKGSMDDVYRYVQTSNTRKHYSPGQRAAIGVRLYYHEYQQKHQGKLPTPAEEVQAGADTSEQLGVKFGCNGYYVRMCRILYRQAPDLLDVVAMGAIPPPKAMKQLKTRQAGGAPDDAPLPPGDRLKVTDARGEEVPDVVSEKFKARAGFRVVRNFLADALNAAAKVAAAPGGEHFNAAAFESAVEALQKSVGDAAPHQVCGKCSGKGKTHGHPCNECAATGFKSKSILKAQARQAKQAAAPAAPAASPDGDGGDKRRKSPARSAAVPAISSTSPDGDGDGRAPPEVAAGVPAGEPAAAG